MTMQIKKYLGCLLALILMAGNTTLMAQQNDAAKKREIREKAYRVISNSYDVYATISSDEARYAFLRLFVDEEAPVYNDLLGLSAATSLSVGDYVRLLSTSNATAKRVIIKNIQMEGEPRLENGQWRVDVSFDKEMSYYDRCQVYYSSSDFYKADYHLVAAMVYDNVDGSCRIERITGSIASTAKLPADYFVFQQTDQRDLQLLYHGKPIVPGANKQAFVGGPFDASGFTHPRYAASKLTPEINACNIVKMNYGRGSASHSSQSDLMALRLHFGLGLGDALSMTSLNGVKKDKASATCFGLDFGYRLAKTDMLTLRGFAGVGLSVYSLDFGFGPFDHQYAAPPSADIDGDRYHRHYDGLTIDQTLKLTELSIPLYADAELAFSPVVSAYADLGLQLNMNMSKKTEVGSATASRIYGVYDRGLVLGGEWGFNDFSDGPTPLSNTATAEVTGIKGTNIDLLGGVGIRCNIPNSPIAIDLGVGIRLGLGDIATPDKVENNEIVEYRVNASGNGSEQLNIAREIESIKRSSLRLNIGVTYKF